MSFFTKCFKKKNSEDLESNDEKPKEEKFPWKIMIPIYLCVMANSVTMTINSPFITEMCRTTWGIPEEWIGFAAGSLIGAFSMATFCSSFILGHLSDLYGRRKLIMLGLFTGTLSTLFFSNMPWYWMALVVRVIAGLTNSNVSITKAIISDVTKPGEIRTLGYAYQGAAFSLSRALSSAVGGLFVGILIPGLPLFDDNPYMLPSFIGGVFNFAGFVLAYWGIPETLRDVPKKKEEKSLIAGLKMVKSNKLLLKTIASFSLNSFANGGLLSSIVLFLNLPREYHGIGFTPNEMGIVFFVFGGVAFIFQVYFFKRLVKRFNPNKLYMFGLISMVFATILFPATGLIYWIFGESEGSTIATWIFLMPVVSVLAVGFMLCLPLLNAMVSNAASDKRQGLVQGTAASVANILRALGPSLTGAIFSLSTLWKFPFLLFLLLTITYIICILIQMRLTEQEKHVLCHGTAEPENAIPLQEHNAAQEVTIANSMETKAIQDDTVNQDQVGLLQRSEEEDEGVGERNVGGRLLSDRLDDDENESMLSGKNDHNKM